MQSAGWACVCACVYRTDKALPARHPAEAAAQSVYTYWYRYLTPATYYSLAAETPPVSRFGLAVWRWAGKQRDFGSNLLQLSFLFKSCGLWTMSCDFVPASQLMKH